MLVLPDQTPVHRREAVHGQQILKVIELRDVFRPGM